MMRKAPGEPEASHGSRSALHDMTSDPFLRFPRDGEKGLNVIETE
jgi:hypothetical protein